MTVPSAGVTEMVVAPLDQVIQLGRAEPSVKVTAVQVPVVAQDPEVQDLIAGALV